MQAFEMLPPQRIKVGAVGAEREPIYAKCATCDEELVAFFIGTGPTFQEIGVLPQDGGPFFKLALWCAACWAKRCAEGEQT